MNRLKVLKEGTIKINPDGTFLVEGFIVEGSQVWFRALVERRVLRAAHLIRHGKERVMNRHVWYTLNGVLYVTVAWFVLRTLWFAI
mgnify:CR=1 FL=1